MIARLWRYMKLAKFGYLGWLIAFVISMSSPGIERGRYWWWAQAGVLILITTLVVGIQWLLEWKYGRRKD